MNIETFATLTAFDERVADIVQFDPLTGAIGAAASPLVLIQGMIADCDLAPDVPDPVRAHFERCRALHTYGCFRYEFFALATEQAYFTLEAGLRARYRADTSTPQRRDPSKMGMQDLLRWGREQGLLYGQRNRVAEEALRQLRNMAAHPDVPPLLTPGISAGAIRDVAEILNHLWGHPTPGGRLYGDSLPVSVIFARRAADGSTMAGCADGLPSLREGDRTPGRWTLMEATRPEEAFAWSPDYDTTAYPASLVWQGESWVGAMEAWRDYRVAGRHPEPREWRGRLFLVRCTRPSTETDHPRPLDPPRSPAQFRGLPEPERDVPGTAWWVVRADHPGDVLAAWSDMQAVPALFKNRAREDLFPVSIELARGSWHDVTATLAELGA